METNQGNINWFLSIFLMGLVMLLPSVLGAEEKKHDMDLLTGPSLERPDRKKEIPLWIIPPGASPQLAIRLKTRNIWLARPLYP